MIWFYDHDRELADYLEWGDVEEEPEYCFDCGEETKDCICNEIEEHEI